MRDSGFSRLQERVQEEVQGPVQEWLQALGPLEVAGLLAALGLLLYLAFLTVMFSLAAAAANRRPSRRRRRPVSALQTGRRAPRQWQEAPRSTVRRAA